MNNEIPFSNDVKNFYIQHTIKERNTTMKKFAAFLITFSILINSASTWHNVLAKDSTSSSVSTTALEQTLPENLELEQALSHGHIQRLKDSEKDLNSATFANVDGSKTVYLFTENIKYIDNNLF